MLYRLFRFIFADVNTSKNVLGRWGYHWELNKSIQKYYD